MPRYTFTCDCGYRDENVVVPMESRDDPVTCPVCLKTMRREFPVEAARGYQAFEAYYDEALNIDITGRRQKQQELKARELVEAGDRVRGAINFDKHAPHHIKPLPPRGITYQWHDEQRRKAEKAESNFMVGVGRPGQKVEYVKASELPNAKDKTASKVK